MKLNQTSYKSPFDWVVSDPVIIPTRGLGRAAGELARQAQEAQRSRGSSGGAMGEGFPGNLVGMGFLLGGG